MRSSLPPLTLIALPSFLRIRTPGPRNYAIRGFILPYDTVRNSESPDQTLLEFLQSTYEAAADLGKWDRRSLERPLTR